MRDAREWFRLLPARINTSARWLITKARGTSKATRISIGISLIILYWLMPADAIDITLPAPEISPTHLGSAVVLFAGWLYLFETCHRH